MKSLNLALVTSLIALAACSSSTSSEPETLTLEQRMKTELSNDNAEGWICKSSQGVNLVYWFYEPGAVFGINEEHQLGLELDPTKATFAEQMRFLWSATGDDSLLLDAPDRGVQVEFTGIEFEAPDFITLNSSTHDTLHCSRERTTREPAL